MNLTLGKVDEEYETKMVAFEVDCNDGNGAPEACHHVGEFYSVVKDQHDRSAKIYEMNCDKNHFNASCFTLGRLFLAGKGVPLNDEKAEEYFDKACKLGHLQGCHHKALMLYNMFNVPKEYQDKKDANGQPIPVPNEIVEEKKKIAMKLFEKTCDDGEYESCYHAASHYIDPKRTDRDPKKAIGLLERACNSSHAPSCYNLAVMYKSGDIGVPKNDAEFEKYKDITNRLIKQFGGLHSKKTA